jgi:glycosyltransferase involved in cell wall biosynthesis
MHILLIHQAFAALDEPGGTRHHELSRYLADQNHQVSIIASPVSYLTGDDRSNSPFLEDKNGSIRIYRTYTYPALHKSFFHRLISFFSFMLSSFFKALSIKKVDLVWGTTPPIFQSFTAWLISRIMGAPFLLEVRDLWPEFAVAVGVLRSPLLIRLSVWLERFLYSHADRIVVNSPGFVEHVAGKGGMNIEVVPNGADVGLFQILETQQARKILGWAEKFTVLYAGAHGMSNDLEVVLKSAKELSGNPDIQFLFVGDGKEKSYLIDKAKKMNLTNVHFLPPVSKILIGQTLSSADACIAILKPIEMYKTTYPNKVFDYMAAGKPVILAIDGVIREEVESADCGIFCSPGDPHDIADAIKFLYNNKNRSRQMGLNGRKYLEEHFDREKIAGKLAGLMEEMVKDG